MKYIERQKQPCRITSGICFSFLMHVVAGLILMSGLLNPITSSPEIKGLKVVWISFDDKKITPVETKNSRPAHHPDPVVKSTDKKNSDIATHANQAETFPLPAFTSASFSTTGTSAKNEASGEMEAISNNAAGYAKNESTTRHAAPDTVIAYPLYKENSPPVYPAIARVRGYEGVVLVSAEILPDGRVGEVKIRKSSGYAILDQSAIQAVKPWKFEPARKSGNPFTAWVELPIKFILHNNS